MLLNRVLDALDGEMKSRAEAALARPKELSAGEYGKQSGYYLGLMRAKEIIRKTLDEEDDHGSKRRGGN